MSENTSPSEEEIDLGQLFTLIGKGFSKIGNAITGLFSFFVQSLISIILFFKRYALAFGIAIIAGFAVGVVLDTIVADEFKATMVVKPNFGSTRQLYKNVSYYNELVTQEDSVLIAETFHISLEEASSLKSFEIEPVIDDNNLLEAYDRFLSSVDSTTVIDFNYDQFIENFSDYSYYYHEISVVSTRNSIFRKLDSTIISSIEDNSFFKKQKEVKNRILLRNRAYLNASLVQVDTLREVYTEVLLTEAKKEMSQGTNINLGGTTESTKELALFGQEDRINKELDVLSKERVENSEVLNVVSNFQKVGFKMNDVTDKSLFRFPLLFVLVLLGWLLQKKLFDRIEKSKKHN